jgi:hypothetical protein
VGGGPLELLCGDPLYYGRWILMVGAGSCLFWLTVNGLSHRRERETEDHYLNHWARAFARLGSCLILFLVPLAGDRLAPIDYMGIATAIFCLNVIMGLENKHITKKIQKKVEKLQSTQSLPGHMSMHRPAVRNYSGLDADQRKLMRDAGLTQSELVHVVKATGGTLSEMGKF